MRVPLIESLSFAASTLLLLSAAARSDSIGNAKTAGATITQSGERVSSDDRVFVPPGDYRVFFKRTNGVERIPVDAFSVDAGPVTKRQYLAFVRENPDWRKSAARALVAEPTYLSDWVGELDPGDDLDAPVTFVSWFGARAYCKKQGSRLPTVAQWERFGGEQTTSSSTETSQAGSMPFRFAMGKAASDLHEAPLKFAAIWEWTEDFNSAPSLIADGAPSSDKPLFCGDGFRSNNAVDYAAFLRFSFRSSLKANYTLKNLGFRCAR